MAATGIRQALNKTGLQTGNRSDPNDSSCHPKKHLKPRVYFPALVSTVSHWGKVEIFRSGFWGFITVVFVVLHVAKHKCKRGIRRQESSISLPCFFGPCIPRWTWRGDGNINRVLNCVARANKKWLPIRFAALLGKREKEEKTHIRTMGLR